MRSSFRKDILVTFKKSAEGECRMSESAKNKVALQDTLYGRGLGSMSEFTFMSASAKRGNRIVVREATPRVARAIRDMEDVVSVKDFRRSATYAKDKVMSKVKPFHIREFV